jgi:T-complex protein 1 subunit eta
LQDYQAIVDAEWQIIFQKLQALADTSAKVVLSKLPIGDLATQYALLTAMLLLDSPTNH